MGISYTTSYYQGFYCGNQDRKDKWVLEGGFGNNKHTTSPILVVVFVFNCFILFSFSLITMVF